jgi:hypothetical protein
MATMKKTNEAWFGDTFNRDVTLCYATEDESNYNTILKSLAMSSPQIIDKDAYGEVTFTCDLANTADSIGYAIGKNASVNQVDSLSDKIRDIQAQLHDLRKILETKKENSELRSALKTLHYTREVE